MLQKWCFEAARVRPYCTIWHISEATRDDFDHRLDVKDRIHKSQTGWRQNVMFEGPESHRVIRSGMMFSPRHGAPNADHPCYTNVEVEPPSHHVKHTPGGPHLPQIITSSSKK